MVCLIINLLINTGNGRYKSSSHGNRKKGTLIREGERYKYRRREDSKIKIRISESHKETTINSLKNKPIKAHKPAYKYMHVVKKKCSHLGWEYFVQELKNLTKIPTRHKKPSFEC